MNWLECRCFICTFHRVHATLKIIFLNRYVRLYMTLKSLCINLDKTTQRHERYLIWSLLWSNVNTVYPKKKCAGFVVLFSVVVTQAFIMNSHEVFIHIHQGCFAGAGAIVRLPQCQWSKPDEYGKISQCITTTKHSEAKIVCIFRGIYCTFLLIETCSSLWKYCWKTFPPAFRSVCPIWSVISFAV